MIERLICLACLVIGYGFGLLQIAHIYSKSKNINIREKGSGNAGTTNMFRVMGIKAGIITLLGDCAKLVAAVILTKLIFITGLHFSIDPTALALYTGFGCVLGHDFPFYFHFKGGKGMATTAALICCMGNWQMIILGLLVFFGIVFLTRYVSLGSMLTISLEAVLFIIFTEVGWFRLDPAWKADCYILMIVNAALLVFQHRKNINRLLHHCEKKFYFRTSSQIQEDEAAHREQQVNAKVEQVQRRADKKVDKIQNRAERRVEKAETRVDKLQARAESNAGKAENRAERLQQKAEQKAEKVEYKADKMQARVEQKAEFVQNKAEYKGRKAQLKAELKQENNRNWAGKLVEYAPKSFKQQDEQDKND